MASEEEKLAELQALVQAIRDRVRAQYPEGSASAGEGIRVPLADLMPVVHARDALQGKAAAIGAVNPRANGLANSAIQFTKRMVARGLNWFVRDQIVFNRSVVGCVETLMETVNGLNRSLVSLGAQISERMEHDRLAAETRAGENAADARALRASVAPLPAKWEQHARETERRFAVHERQALASEAATRELVHAQHRNFELALEAGANEIQSRVWADMERIRLEFERVIHAELRTVRQRGLPPSPAHNPAPSTVDFDYPAFADRFRGSEDRVKAGQQFYIPRFRGVREVVDLGCGRGEFLETMRDAGIPARGIDSSAESVQSCRSKSLTAEQSDLFEWLNRQPDRSLAALFCSQVVEHLPPERLPAMIQLCAAKLERDGLIAVETPNPECLAIFATHFYLDPTHTRPVPHPLLAFYLQESGMGLIEVVTRFPAAESWPELNELPAAVRDRFFGGLDYAIFARKL
ncbi:MAG: class I SAM-dependent methyltransferase [Acidobacteriota bacterium]|nr:class I SAM-dependent methyltransferase [Acidobacteriota bacterium]